MTILNIAGYKFVKLSNLSERRVSLFNHAAEAALKGTVLLSPEGINLSLAGALDNIRRFQQFLSTDPAFNDLSFRESNSDTIPFDRLKIKIKKEIITLRQPDIQPTDLGIAPNISPKTLKQWLDEKRDITLLDTRNDYEIRFGTFKNALNLQLNDFSEFPEKMATVPQTKPLVMFCTGGVRCEKAAHVMLKAGYTDVYQLEGGILNYFAEMGGTHYDGECFVFDQRVAVDTNLTSVLSKKKD